MYVSECVCVEATVEVGSALAGKGHSIEHRKVQEKDRSYGQIRLN